MGRPQVNWKALWWVAALVLLWVEPAHPEESSYEPKVSADTVLDYRRSLEDRLRKLPPPTLDSLGELLKTLDTLQAAAAKNPGHQRQGNLPLGAEPNEYVPSDEELLISEVGDRIRSIAARTPPRQLTTRLNRVGFSGRFIEYNAIAVYHADVMGSGRFFYARRPTPVRVRLRQ